MDKKKVATKEQEGYAGCAWCLGNLIDGTPCWRLLKKPYPGQILDCCYYNEARKVLPELIAISLEEIAGIRRALQIIQLKVQPMSSSCMPENRPWIQDIIDTVIKQVKRINRLLPKEVVDKIEERSKR